MKTNTFKACAAILTAWYVQSGSSPGESVPDPFLAIYGHYEGLFYNVAGITPESSGALALELTPRGSFTGHLESSAGRTPVSGKFDTTGAASLNITNRNKAALTMALQVNFDANPVTISGTISSETWSATLSAERAGFDGLASIAPQAGRWTMILPGHTYSTNEPGGSSYGVLSVDKAGRVVLIANMSDRSKFSRAGRLSATADFAVYVPLYARQGAVLGSVSVGADLLGYPYGDFGGSWTWMKPADAHSKYYPDGFVFQGGLNGSRYYPPAPGENILNITNGVVQFGGGGLKHGIVNQIEFGAHNKVTNLSTNSLSLRMSEAMGLFRGEVTDPVTSEKISFGGVVLLDVNVGAGYFLGANQSGEVRVWNE